MTDTLASRRLRFLPLIRRQKRRLLGPPLLLPLHRPFPTGPRPDEVNEHG